MIIAHASLPADDPAKAAKVLARIMGGEAMPFPPGGANTWMAWSGDNAIELEIAPHGIELGAGPDGANWVVKAETPRRANEAHLAIGVDKSAEEIMDIAHEAGWPTARYDRGGFFHVVEVWVEGAFLIEFLDPAETASYRRTMTPENWKAVFGVQAAA